MPFSLVLASQSPRRRELLSALGIRLEVRPAETDEAVMSGELPRSYVTRLAREKARAVGGEVVLAADTAVVLGQEILGKPQDPADAARMLRALSGTAHEVLTAVCVRRNRPGPELERLALVSTEVRFRPLREEEIRWYVATGEPLDKAGAYALQGAGGALVESVSGSVSGVVGLPLVESLALLAEVGFSLPWSAS
ncbi:MAG TPA: Maf family protein [Anaeromyxobacter sp.]|nr:Maf family protein [Anaeromyxobacter sp.]